jgi:hypothetical protein
MATHEMPVVPSSEPDQSGANRCGGQSTPRAGPRARKCTTGRLHPAGGNVPDQAHRWLEHYQDWQVLYGITRQCVTPSIASRFCGNATPK